MNQEMNKLELYEKKIIEDEEFPIQFMENIIERKGEYFKLHWHEHIELHYLTAGSGIYDCNQKRVTAKEGSLVIFNSNELHRGVALRNIKSIVIIFELSVFSQEIAHEGIIFQNLIDNDIFIQQKMQEIFCENQEKQIGYKLASKGILYALITYLLRNYVVKKLDANENSKRNKNLIRLNTVIQYIEQNYTEPISNKTLASLIHLSEDRFNHLFRESMGISPLNYMNEIRLKKAKHLLETGEYTVSEVALEVGFYDLNHFGRLFRKKYQCTPSSLLK